MTAGHGMTARLSADEMIEMPMSTGEILGLLPRKAGEDFDHARMAITEITE